MQWIKSYFGMLEVSEEYKKEDEDKKEDEETPKVSEEDKKVDEETPKVSEEYKKEDEETRIIDVKRTGKKRKRDEEDDKRDVVSDSEISGNNSRSNIKVCKSKKESEESTSPDTSPTDVIKFTKHQQACVGMAATGHNFFITGNAGAGKSETVKRIVQVLRDKYKKNVAVCSTTGISSESVGGRTIHRFAGVGYEKVYERMLERALLNAINFLQTDTLVIDEISMLSAQFLDNLTRIAQHIRGNTLLFGGIQIILSGDFFQLPPVERGKGNSAKRGVYCFKSAVFKNLDYWVHLGEVFRQGEEQKSFVKVLNELRLGDVSREGEKLLKQRVYANFLENIDSMEEEEVVPTYLCGRNDEADRINLKYLGKLSGNAIRYSSFDCVIRGEVPKEEFFFILSSFFQSKS